MIKHYQNKSKIDYSDKTLPKNLNCSVMEIQHFPKFCWQYEGLLCTRILPTLIIN